MRSNGKKVFIIILIILVLIIGGTVATVMVLMNNGILAITKEQKLNRGLNDISKNLDKNLEFESIVEETGASKTTTTITAVTNNLEIKYFEGYDAILDEIEEMIDNLTIENVVQVDKENKRFNETFSLQVGDILKELSAEFRKDEEGISIRSKELNNKYIVLDENTFDFSKTEDITSINPNNIKLSDGEKQYFIDNYKSIFTENINADMIQEMPTQINVNGKDINCTSFVLNLNNSQIATITSKLFDKIETDEGAMTILLAKINAVNADYDKLDLYTDLRDFKLMLEEIDNMKISMYCSLTNTYGFNIDITISDKIINMSNLFSGDYNFIGLKTSEGLNISISSVANDIRISANTSVEGNKVDFIYNQNNGLGEGNLKIENIANAIDFKIGMKTDVSNLKDIKLELNTQYIDDNNDIDITFNIENKTEYIKEVEVVEYNNRTALYTQEYTEEEVKEYIDSVFENVKTLAQNAADNSQLIKVYYNYFNVPILIDQYKELFSLREITQSTSNGEISNSQLTESVTD